MATFVDLHQSQKLILVTVEAVQAVMPHSGGQPGAEVFFTDGTEIDVDETSAIFRGYYNEKTNRGAATAGGDIPLGRHGLRSIK